MEEEASKKKTSNFKNISEFITKTYEELEQTKSELEQTKSKLNKTNQTKKLESSPNKQFERTTKINSELKEKIIFLQNLTASLNARNEELETANRKLYAQKTENNKLTLDLRRNLEKTLLKEKEVELQRDFLSRQLAEKTNELLKSEKLAIIGELASRMAHDLRNPLSIIKNAVEIMETKPKLKTEKKLQYYAKLNRAINRMKHQVDDVLDFVRISDLSLQPNSILDIMNSVKDNVTVPNDVKINVEQTDVRLNCDYRKIEAVFSNLLINAIQAVGTEGEINIGISEDANNITIAFDDTGQGIPKNIVDKIFEPLFTTKQSGTGLGLSICKHIVEQHGGSISLKSNPTTFIVRLPKNL